MRSKLLGIGSIFLVGCATPAVPVQQDVFYRRDMQIEADGRSGDGTLVLPAGARHQLKIEAHGDLDLFTLTTCHRELASEKAWDRGIFKSHRQVSVDYAPVRGLEDTGACPIQLGGYEAKRGRHSWGLIDFETPDAVLPATVRCNGKQWASNGVTICQARAGLLQEIEFPVEVINASLGCQIGAPGAKGKVWRFVQPKGECVLAFAETQGAKRFHRLTLLGYERVLLREP